MSRTSKIVYFIISIIFFTCFDLVLSDFVIKNIEKFPQNSVLDLISGIQPHLRTITKNQFECLASGDYNRMSL